MSTVIAQPGARQTGLAPSERSGAMRAFAAGSRSIILPLLLAAVVLVLWEVGVRTAGVPEVILPPPSAIATVLISKHEILLRHAQPTILESAGGFALASILGIGLAILLSYSRIAREALYPNLVFFQLIPKIALAPLLHLVWHRV